MAKKKALIDAEALVRRVLTESFKQKADAETVRAVAEKISHHGAFGHSLAPRSQEFGEISGGVQSTLIVADEDALHSLAH